MSWTYSGNPSKSDRDAVRFWIGDTDENSQQLADEEIDYLLAQESTAKGAAAEAAYALAAKYARLVTQSVGDLSISYGERQQHYRDLAARLSTDDLRGIVPYAGGIEVSDRETREADTTLTEPAFKMGLMDNE